jgi:hypothetical protein
MQKTSKIVLNYMIYLSYNYSYSYFSACAIAAFNSGHEIMAFGSLPAGMPTELGDALIAIDAVALVAFFGMIYSSEIAALSGRLRTWLSPSQIVARCRQWLAANKTSN